MKFRLIVSTAVALSLGASFAFASGNLKEDREAAMKGIGGAMGALVKIAKGENPYDAEVVKASLSTMSANAKSFPDLFPSADAVVDPEASPKIWETMDDFKAKSAKLAADADAALAALPADAAAVGAALQTLGGNCQSCHEAYRLKAN